MSKKRKISLTIFTLLFLITILITHFYYNTKFSVSFDTKTDELLLTKYVKYGSKVSKPDKIEREGYIFKEWQLDGKKFDFDTKIEKNITLVAVWEKEEYITLSFDLGNHEYKEPIKIIKNTIPKLIEPTLDDCDFKGWFINSDEYTFYPLYEDTLLQAKYECKKLEIGDIVIITGKYSNSVYGDKNNSCAIGWTRTIINIIENVPNKYVVGNSSGITGYFTKDSLKEK